MAEDTWNCRLCYGTTIRKYDKRDKPVCAWIWKAFSIDVAKDRNSHPAFVCDKCRRKLSHFCGKSGKKQKAKLNIKLHDFGPDEDEPEPEHTPQQSNDKLFSELEGLAKKYGFQKWEQPSGDVFYITFNASTLTVDRCVSFTPDKKWTITVQGSKQAPTLNPRLHDIPEECAVDNLDTIFNVASGSVCVGNPDYWERLKNIGKDGQAGAIREDNGPYMFREHSYPTTLRKISCTKLAVNKDGQCRVCSHSRGDFNSMCNQSKNSKGTRTAPSSHVKHSQMSNEELKEKLNNVQVDRRRLQRKISRMQEQMENLIDAEAISMVGSDAVEMDKIVGSCTKELDSLLVHDTPQKLLWESQKDALKLAEGNPRLMRWHPAIIRWCVALYTKSPAAYKSIRDSRFMILPHQNTIKDYIHYTDLKPGFDGKFIMRLVKDFDLKNQPEQSRHVCVLVDEVKIKSGLAYCHHSGKIVGFTQLGTFNEEIKAFERQCFNNDEPPIATHMLVLMVRGITSHLQKPLAYFPCQGGFTAYELYNTITEAVELLEFVGFKVHSLTGDGASANRKLFTLQKNPNDDSSTIRGTTFATNHIIRPKDRLFFMSDVPHLMKTTRNCWEHSTANGTRNMMYKGLPIRWGHLHEVYNWDTDIEGNNPSLKMMHKIHNEHLHLTPSLRMRVYLAVQVLSDTVANAMESMKDYLKKPELQSTITFIQMFNKFFDCMNVTNFKAKKPNLQPYRSPDDPRFLWLTDTFLNFLEEWQHEADELDLTADEKRRLCLSSQTLEGLRITVFSFVHLAKNLLKEPGVTVILSEKFCQDPLEEYFSRQRAAGGGNNNPTVPEFRNNTLSEQVGSEASRIISKSRRGNTRNKRRLTDSDIMNIKPLQKRKRAKKHHKNAAKL